ncbi:MAG: ComF family protein [Erysipelotrichaceae bacterium]|nr:ComF family protein [Erysipelotrichaceae bacterium]
MQRCLWCHEDIYEGRSLSEVLWKKDVLCGKCRHQWEVNHRKFKINGIEAYSPYIYNDAFASCLIQYKECFDEALAPIFLCEQLTWFKWRYKGYTLIPIPSSYEKVRERGFSHVNKMFEMTGLPILDALEKVKDESQKEKGMKERKKMEEGIRLKEGIILPKKILLVDDVCTTGSSLRGALRVVKGKRKIKIFTVAVTSMNFR